MDKRTKNNLYMHWVSFFTIYSSIETFASIELTFGFDRMNFRSKQPSIELTRYHSILTEIFVICWIESVDPVADLCLTNQIYSVLLNAFEFKEITEVQASSRWQNARWRIASTRHHRARLLKYYPRPPCAPILVKSRMIRPLPIHFLHSQQIFFVLVCIRAGNPRVPPRVLASGPKPCGGNKSDSRWMVVRFCYDSNDYRPNWTPLSPITITYLRILIGSYLWSITGQKHSWRHEECFFNQVALS